MKRISVLLMSQGSVRSPTISVCCSADQLDVSAIAKAIYWRVWQVDWRVLLVTNSSPELPLDYD